MYILICSAGRSGSTLLDILVGQHPDITSLGEIAHLPKNISLNTECSCGKKVMDCDFWNGVFDRLKNGGVAIREKPYDFQLGFHMASRVIDKNRQTKGYILKRKFKVLSQYFTLIGSKGRRILPVFRTIESNSIKLYRAVMQEAETQHIVESTKDSLRAVIHYLLNPSNTKIVLLCRDGRGVLNSNLKHNSAGVRPILGWRLYYEKTFALLNKLVPEKDVIYVKYDDLVNSFDETVTDIFKKLELKPPRIDKDKVITDHHILNGNNMRMKKNFRIKHDDEWIDNLTKKQKKYFNLLGKKINDKFDF